MDIFVTMPRGFRALHALRAAFVGQLVPQDAYDVPAAVLLERIGTERAVQELA